MTQQEFNNKYKRFLKPKSFGLCLNPEAPSDIEITAILDQIFSSVLIHIPCFQYEFLHRTALRRGFTFGSNLPEIAGEFGRQLQDLVEECCYGASAFYEAEED